MSELNSIPIQVYDNIIILNESKHTLPSGRIVQIVNVTQKDIEKALAIVGEDEFINLREGNKNGAALIERLDLVAQLALVQQLDEDAPNEELLDLNELSLEDKFAIYDSAYQGSSKPKSFRTLLLEASRIWLSI